ncbi:hypothetical protein QE374_002157 [Microbacterium sp. SORGH_AS428]|uniref:DUF6286 domain-containing protein n=1 Tax=Microbacterium sp. SORGH_AS_0428 TaxID=3041788 RepID=UPI00285C46AA|nr:DUF6286 domain-containing protein [Microbacterium sp. SORGH_AS_0428]MDR6200248.1 hypothetical protein [Microbacterium sp. SORGH_AS_0428]
MTATGTTASSDRALARVRRRETHSPRSTAMVVAVVLLIALVAYLATEIVLVMADAPSLIAAPADLLRGLAAASGTVMTAIGAAVALLGAVLVVIAVTPGRLAKHTMAAGDGTIVVVDNGVVAAAIAQHLSDTLGIDRRRLTVGVGHRRVDVTVRPETGLSIDLDEVRAAADAELATYRLSPSVVLSVHRRLDKKEER